MSDSSRHRERERFADRAAIYVAQRNLKAAKRALSLANRKLARRVARVEAAMQALTAGHSEVEAAQAALKVAQKANDLAFINAVKHDQLATDRATSRSKSHK